MDTPTISALAGWIAAAVAATVAGIQFYIGRKQAQAALISAQAALMNAQNAGRHTVAEFRQKWIDKVIDTLCENLATLMSIITTDHTPSREERKQLAATRTRLEILLNPDEPDTIELLKLIDEIGANREAPKSGEMLVVARRLLKREWVRIKDELR